MTIAKHLIILVALIGLGICIRMEFAQVEAHSRFVAEKQISSLAALGNKVEQALAVSEDLSV